MISCGCLRPFAVFSPTAAFGQHLFVTVPSHMVPCGILRPFEVSPSLRPSTVFCTIRFLQSFHTRPLLAAFAFAYFHTRPLLAAFAFSQSSGTKLLVTALALSQSSGTRLSSHMVTFAGAHLVRSLSHMVASGNNRISQSSSTRLLVAAFVAHSCFCRRSPLSQSFHTVAFGIIRLFAVLWHTTFVAHGHFCRRSPRLRSFAHGRFRKHSPLHSAQ